MQEKTTQLTQQHIDKIGRMESEHACLLYDKPDRRFSAISRFVFASIVANRRCIYIGDINIPEDILAKLTLHGRDFSDAMESGQFRVHRFGQNLPDMESLLGGELGNYLHLQLDDAQKNGFENINLVIEMDWARNPQNLANLMNYEAEIDRFLQISGASALCCYYTGDFSSDAMCRIIATHKLILSEEKLTINPAQLSFQQGAAEEPDACGNLLELMDNWQSHSADSSDSGRAADELSIEKDWILNVAKESFILYDSDAKILWANNSAGAIAGMEPDEMQGLDCASARGCDGSNCPDCPVSKVKRTGKPAEGELLSKEGRDLYLRVYPIYNENARMTHIIEYGRDVTERKQAEATLRGTLTELNAINANVPVAIILLNSDLEIHKLNEAAVRMTGHDPLNLLGSPPGEALGCLNHLDNPGGCGTGSDCAFCTLRSSVTHTLKTGQPHHNVEAWLPFGNGDTKQYKCMLISTSKISLMDDELILVSIQDISDIKRTEQQLHLAEIRNRKILDSSPMFIMLVRDGKYIYANPSAARTLGYSGTDELIGMPTSINIPDGQLQRIRGEVSKVGSDAAKLAQIDLVRHDGTSFAAEAMAVSVRFQDGAATLVMGSDISKQVETQQALVESQQRFRAILETIDLYAVILNNEGVITYVNPHYCEKTGWDSAEVIGKSWFEHLPDDKADDVKEVFKNAVQSGELPAHREDMLTTRDGQHRHVVWNNVILRNSQGRIAGTASIGMDITEHRRLEQQYQQSQKMEAIGRLAAGVAHDFNNQLTVIQGYCEMLLSGINETDPRFRPLSEINRASLRAYSTTSHLLSFSRKQLLNPEVIELDKLLQEMRNPVSKMIGEDIRLSVITTEGLKPVKIDRSGMHQALMNLMVNARDAMPDGGDLTIKATNVNVSADAATSRFNCSSPGEYVLLEVSDTGTGMDEETMDKLFEPFFTTKEVGKGTGLGLPMVQGFVKQSHGFISVSSEPGKGATFSILLPPAKQPAPAKKDPAKRKEFAGKGTETILAVEDEESVRMLLTDLLGMCGYDIHVAENYEQAMEIAQQLDGKFDMLLTDMVMPEISGTELAKHVAEKYGEVPTLFMTGYASSKIRGEAKNILTKPFTPDSLTEAIRKTLDGKILLK